MPGMTLVRHCVPCFGRIHAEQTKSVTPACPAISCCPLSACGFADARQRRGRQRCDRAAFTKFPPGTKENPLSVEAVSAKTRDLIAPVLGAEKADRLIQAINSLETRPDIRALRPFMTV